MKVEKRHEKYLDRNYNFSYLSVELNKAIYTSSGRAYSIVIILKENAELMAKTTMGQLLKQAKSYKLIKR